MFTRQCKRNVFENQFLSKGSEQKMKFNTLRVVATPLEKIPSHNSKFEKKIEKMY